MSYHYWPDSHTPGAKLPYTRSTDTSISFDLSRTDQWTPTRSRSTSLSSTELSSTTSTRSIRTSPPTSLPVVDSTSNRSPSTTERHPTSPPASSPKSPNPSVNSASSVVVPGTQSTQSSPSASVANNVSPTSISGATPTPVPILSTHSLPTSTIAAAVVVPIIVSALIGAAVLIVLRRRRRQGYTRTSSGTESTRLNESAAGILHAEKLLHSHSHDTASATTPAPAYVSHGQHTGAQSESAQPMLSVPQHDAQPSMLDRAYYTGMDTTSEASIHGDETKGYHDSREGSFVGEAPPPYVRSLGSGRSASSGGGGASTPRAPTLVAASTNRRGIEDESAAEEPETPRANAISPFRDPTGQARRQAKESPFDDGHATKDDDAVSEISEPADRERDTMSEVSDLSYQTSLKSSRASNAGKSRR